MGFDADQVIKEAEQDKESVSSRIREASEWFHEREGEMFERNEARRLLIEELGIDSEMASKLLGELIGDSVDPVVQAKADGQKHVGVVEFNEFEGSYGYIDYDDVKGKRKKVVCQRCVNSAENDSKIFQAVAGNKENSSYDELLEAVDQHYQDEHSDKPEEVETGATLASGTTIGGNISYHSGNYPGETIQVPVYSSTSDLPNSSEGSIAYVSNDGSLYVEDGS